MIHEFKFRQAVTLGQIEMVAVGQVAARNLKEATRLFRALGKAKGVSLNGCEIGVTRVGDAPPGGQTHSPLHQLDRNSI